MAHSRNFNLFRIDPAQGAVQMAGDVAREVRQRPAPVFVIKFYWNPVPLTCLHIRCYFQTINRIE